MIGMNMVIARIVTTIKQTHHGGVRAKSASTNIFQHPGKPENELSLVFIRVSQKYIALAKVTMMIITHPDQPSMMPDLNRAKAGMNT